MRVVTDGNGGPVIEKIKESSSRLRPFVPIPYIIHSPAVCTKSVTLDSVMNVVVKTENFIRYRIRYHAILH